MVSTLTIAAAVALVAALITVPFGLPGVWMMIGILLIGAIGGVVSWPWWLALAAITAAAEAGEYWLLSVMGTRFGGSRRAFWAAILGGFVGVFVGMPVPILGPILAGFLGSFAGAALVTLGETRSAGKAGRAGWGVLLARVGAVVLKVGVGVVVLVVGVWQLLIG